MTALLIDPRCKEPTQQPTRTSADQPPHAMAATEVLQWHDVDPRSGLSHARASELRARHGPNVLAEEAPTPGWQRFLRRFTDVVVLVLICAAVIAARAECSIEVVRQVSAIEGCTDFT